MEVSGHAQETALASGKIPRPWGKGCSAVPYSLTTISSNHLIAMMTVRFTVSDAIDLLCDDDFGLSDSYLSKEECDRLYAYLGDHSLSREAVEDLRELDESHSQTEAG